MAVIEAPAQRPGARLLKNIGLLTGSQVTTWLITLLWTLIVPRILGPRAIGMLTTAVATVGIVATLVVLGLTVLLVKEIARDRRRASRLVGGVLLLEVVLYLPAVAVIVLFMNVSGFEYHQKIVLLIAAAGMLPMVLRAPLEASLQGLERMEYSAMSGVISKVVNSVGGVILVLLGLGVIPLTFLGLAAESLVLALNVRWYRKYFSVDWKVPPRQLGRLFASSLPYGATYLVANVYTYIDSVMLAIFTAATVVGWYGVSTRLLGTLMFMPVIVSTALLPRLSSVFDGTMQRVYAAAQPVFELILCFSLPITAGTIMVAGPVVRLLYGPDFDSSAVVLAVAVVSVPFTYFNILAWKVLVAANRQGVWAKVMVVTTVANIALNAFLIPPFQAIYHDGAIGSAAALVATEAIMSAAALWLLKGLLTGRSWGRLMRCALATLAMSAAVWWAERYGLPAELAVGFVTFAAAAFALRVVAVPELRWLWGMIRAGRRVEAAA